MRTLNVSRNRLASLLGLRKRFPRLTALFADDNALTMLAAERDDEAAANDAAVGAAARVVVDDDFSPPKDLVVLSLAGNQLASTAGLAHLQDLEELNLARNHLSTLSALSPLASLPLLRALSLSANPIELQEGHWTNVLATLPSLTTLEGMQVTAEDRVRAAIWKEAKDRNGKIGTNNFANQRKIR